MLQEQAANLNKRDGQNLPLMPTPFQSYILPAQSLALPHASQTVKTLRSEKRRMASVTGNSFSWPLHTLIKHPRVEAAPARPRGSTEDPLFCSTRRPPGTGPPGRDQARVCLSAMPTPRRPSYSSKLPRSCCDAVMKLVGAVSRGCFPQSCPGSCDDTTVTDTGSSDNPAEQHPHFSASLLALTTLQHSQALHKAERESCVGLRFRARFLEGLTGHLFAHVCPTQLRPRQWGFIECRPQHNKRS